MFDYSFGVALVPYADDAAALHRIGCHGVRCRR
jgi:hypothetical protein